MLRFVATVMRVAATGKPYCATTTPEAPFVARGLLHHVSETAACGKGAGHGGTGLHAETAAAKERRKIMR